MQRIRMELFHSKTQNSSPEQVNKQSPRKIFTPFQNERDSMNRLIRHRPLDKTCGNDQDQRNTQEESENVKEAAMNRRINEIFQQQNIFAESQSKKKRIGKKTVIQILSEDPKKTMVNNLKNDSTALMKRKSVNSSHSNRFSKKHSLQLYKTSSQFQLELKRINSTVVSRQFSTVQSRKSQSTYSQNSPKKPIYYQPQVNIQENLHKYPELNRYRRMKQLQVKLNNDIEATHDRFLGKMIHSKQLAYEVKINLDKIGYY